MLHISVFHFLRFSMSFVLNLLHPIRFPTYPIRKPDGLITTSLACSFRNLKITNQIWGTEPQIYCNYRIHFELCFSKKMLAISRFKLSKHCLHKRNTGPKELIKK